MSDYETGHTPFSHSAYAASKESLSLAMASYRCKSLERLGELDGWPLTRVLCERHDASLEHAQRLTGFHLARVYVHRPDAQLDRTDELDGDDLAWVIYNRGLDPEEYGGKLTQEQKEWVRHMQENYPVRSDSDPGYLPHTH